MIYNILIMIVVWIPPSDQNDLLVASHSDFDRVPCKKKIFYIKNLLVYCYIFYITLAFSKVGKQPRNPKDLFL